MNTPMLSMWLGIDVHMSWFDSVNFVSVREGTSVLQLCVATSFGKFVSQLCAASSFTFTVGRWVGLRTLKSLLLFVLLCSMGLGFLVRSKSWSG